MLKQQLTKEEIREVLESTRKDISKVLDEVVSDSLRTPEQQEEFIEAGLTTTYKLIDSAIDEARLKSTLKEMLKLN